MTERIAFRMTLNFGQAQEYKRRHDEIWPDLAQTLRAAGISDYSIWLDPETNALFATLVRREDHQMAGLPDREIVQRWWKHMADIMETHPNNVPVQVQLKQVFFLP